MNMMPIQKSNEEIVEILKDMIFGKKAFERFTSDERTALSRAIKSLEQKKE